MLKALMTKKKIDDKNAELEKLRAKSAEFETRESEIATMIGEAETDEERAAVESEIEGFENEKAANASEIGRLEDEIRSLTEQLKMLETEQAKTVETPVEEKDEKEERKTKKFMKIRDFYGMTAQERDAFFAEESVKDFLANVRTAIREKRAITNVGLTIPEVMIGLIEEEVEASSKLLRFVHLESIKGSGRQLIMGSYPEAVWTEMCATLNELSLGFNDVEVDGYKVGGYFAVCNAVLEDNDVALSQKIIKALGVAISKALDKAILYGTGTKMPQGIVTRLAETAAPADYPATARAWVDLSQTNIIAGTNKSGINLFKEIASHLEAIINVYESSNLVWVMNKKTHMRLVVESMGVNANAAIVSGISNQMPVVGGEIVELDFVPDDNIVVGYFGAYLMVQRAGVQLAQSEHAKFIEDKTVFKGTARYDGKPAIAEAFAVFTTTSAAPTTTVTFPQDTAN